MFAIMINVINLSLIDKQPYFLFALQTLVIRCMCLYFLEKHLVKIHFVCQAHLLIGIIAEIVLFLVITYKNLHCKEAVTVGIIHC